MWARVSTYEGSPGALDEDTRYSVETIMPQVRQLDGFVGVYSLGDRTSGKSISITLWADEDAMRASEEAANRLRDDGADHTGEVVVDVERFEVLFHEHV